MGQCCAYQVNNPHEFKSFIIEKETLICKIQATLRSYIAKRAIKSIQTHSKINTNFLIQNINNIVKVYHYTGN